MIKVGITMPCINLWKEYTDQALLSVFVAIDEAKEHGIEASILLIDNGSTDGTKEKATQLALAAPDKFIYKHNDDIWNFQETVNFGFDKWFQTDAELVLTLNNDILLHKDAIWRLVERFAKRDVDMVTCMDIRGDCPNPRDLFNADSEEMLLVEEADHPNFSAFMINKHCYVVVGEFDEIYAPCYFEDNDYHYRMKLMHMNAIVYPPALFYHYGSRSQNEALGNGKVIASGDIFDRNRNNFVRKWGGVPGDEKYSVPYRDTRLTIKSTRQLP